MLKRSSSFFCAPCIKIYFIGTEDSLLNLPDTSQPGIKVQTRNVFITGQNTHTIFRYCQFSLAVSKYGGRE